jgi:uncharacterized lipoprotein YmbA
MTKLIWVFFWLLTACGSNAPTQFYMLNAETEPATPASLLTFDKSLLVGLGPIHLPDYLNRPQIVIEVSENQYRLDEQHRWAERLDQNIDRTLAKFLADRLAITQVIRYPWAQRQTIDYQVSIDILEFHQTAGGVSRLAAQWQIKYREQSPLSKRFDCSITSRAEPEAIVKAQSECLGRLGGEIELGLRQLANAGQAG